MCAPVGKHKYRYLTAAYFNCYSNRDDADNGYKDSHRVGLVLLMPCLVHGREGENMS